MGNNVESARGASLRVAKWARVSRATMTTKNGTTLAGREAVRPRLART